MAPRPHSIKKIHQIEIKQKYVVHTFGVIWFYKKTVNQFKNKNVFNRLLETIKRD